MFVLRSTPRRFRMRAKYTLLILLDLLLYGNLLFNFVLFLIYDKFQIGVGERRVVFVPPSHDVVTPWFKQSMYTFGKLAAFGRF